MIYYLGYYDCECIDDEKRYASPPAINKMSYMISALAEATIEETIVVSPSETELRKYVKGSLHDLNENISLKTFDSFQSRWKIIRGFGYFWTKIQLFRFLKKNVKSEDTIIVYHSLILMRIVKKIKKIKGCNLIIEAEEIYSDVAEDQKMRAKELKYLQIADKYIIITELLNEQVNLKNKPKLIYHGTYKPIQKYGSKFEDDKNHIVYAGTFDPTKGGVFAAVEAAQHLSEEYVLHILGKGTDKEVKSVKEKINQIQPLSKCEIVFDGYKTGREFDEFMQSCHVGLSTQQPGGKYNASSFPSKILMYMSNGIRVVSVDIPAVRTSKVGKYINYYENQNPEEISSAIRSINFEDHYDSRQILDELHKDFVEQLKKLLIG